MYFSLGPEEIKELFDYLYKWQKENKISKKDLSMYYCPDTGRTGYLRVVGDKHYYHIYLDKQTFENVGKIVKKGVVL